MRSNGCDIFVVHAEFSARRGMKTEELLGRKLARQHPVMRLKDDQREAVEGRGLAAEERLFGPLYIYLEEKGRVLRRRFCQEERLKADDLDFDALVVGICSIAHVSAIGAEIRMAVLGTNACLSKIDIQSGTIPAQEVEVIRRGFDGNDVGLRVSGGEPCDAGTDVGSAVDDQRLLSGGQHLLINLFDENTMGADGHIVLELLEALLNGKDVIGAPSPVLNGKMPSPIFDFGYHVIGGDAGIHHASREMDERTSGFKCHVTGRSCSDAIDHVSRHLIALLDCHFLQSSLVQKEWPDYICFAVTGGNMK